MVPKPVWHDRPVEKTYDPEVKTDADVPELETPLATKVSGRWWKGDNKPTVRTSAGSKNKDQLDKAWKMRAERNQRDKAVKLIEKCVARSSASPSRLSSEELTFARCASLQGNQGGESGRP